jgi:cytoskeletal protein RodZ
MKARQLAAAWCVAGALALAVPALGVAAPAAKPKHATAKCTDGTYSTSKSKQGACSGHGGIATWYADEKAGKAAAKTAEKDTKAAAKDTKTAAKTVEKETTAAAAATSKEAKTVAKATEKDAKTATKAVEKDTKTAAKATEKEAKAVTAARPAGAPGDATAQCNDGTYSFAKQHSGACSSHGGVKTWYK